LFSSPFFDFGEAAEGPYGSAAKVEDVVLQIRLAHQLEVWRVGESGCQ
jgi:hypothetical protein